MKQGEGALVLQWCMMTVFVCCEGLRDFEAVCAVCCARCALADQTVVCFCGGTGASCLAQFGMWLLLLVVVVCALPDTVCALYPDAGRGFAWPFSLMRQAQPPTWLDASRVGLGVHVHVRSLTQVNNLGCDNSQPDTYVWSTLHAAGLS